VYEVLLGLTALMIALLYIMPESSTRKTGALASLRPHVRVPPQSRAILARLTPANVAAWALGGLHLSLMPTVVTTAMGVASPWVGGIVVATLMSTAAIAVAAFRDWPARQLILMSTSTLGLGVAISMVGIQQQQVAALLGGTIVAGAARIAAYRRTPSARRAALCVLPAVLSGVQRASGYRRTIGPADRACDHRLSLRRLHYAARLHLDDGVAVDGSLRGEFLTRRSVVVIA
jgi:hypothetical protein